MDADIQRTCVRCAKHFWWTIEEQEDFAERNLPAPKRCPVCHAPRLEAPARQAHGLAKQEPSATGMTFPELHQPLITEDIRQLIAEASAPLQARLRTMSEWLRGENVREKQLAEKLRAGEAANILVRQRAEFMASVSDIVTRAEDFRRQRLEAQLTELDLQDRILERVALRDARLATLFAIETRKQRQFLEPTLTPVSERDRTLDEYRLDREARARAGRDLLDDFLREVHLVCESRTSIHERALQLRNILAAFELDEESLPADARWIITTSEKLFDGA